MTGESLADAFEQQRGRLRMVAYRMLGSLSDADDAVQDAWLRISRADATRVENLDAWLTTVVARVCLNLLRARRRHDPLDVHVPDLLVSAPDDQVELADSVGLAMLVVLESLAPAERLAFVLHDMFAVPFDEIAVMIERSPQATRQLASRARRRIQQAPVPDPDRVRQRDVVNAFFAATRSGDFEALVTLLHPDVVLRSDGGSSRPRLTLLARGAQAVIEQARMAANASLTVRPVLVNGAAGALIVAHAKPLSLMAFTVTGGRIAAIDVLADPDRLASYDQLAHEHPAP